MKKQKILVAYYSRNGHTKNIAIEMAKKLGADIDEIVDLKDRERVIFGWLVSGKDATLRKMTEIKFKKDPSKYDLVLIGTPVWVWTVTPAIRTYLANNKFKKVGFFCTCGSQIGNTFNAMEKLSKKPIKTMFLQDIDIRKNFYEGELNKFCEGLK